MYGLRHVVSDVTFVADYCTMFYSLKTELMSLWGNVQIPYHFTVCL